MLANSLKVGQMVMENFILIIMIFYKELSSMEDAKVKAGL